MAREAGEVLPEFQRKVLRLYAKKLPHGQESVADELGVHRVTFNRWLQGWPCGHYSECIALCRRAIAEYPEIAETAHKIKALPKSDTVKRAKYIQRQLGCTYKEARRLEPHLSATSVTLV